MKYRYKKGILYFYFFGDLDNLSVCNLKDTIIELIEKYKPKTVKFDFEEVTFVDSTGIGFVLARYKQLEKMKASLVLCNLSSMNRKIFSMSGVFQLMKEERNEVKL